MDNRILKPLSERNFRLLWAGQGVSLLGDQFFFIAMAWLAELKRHKARQAAEKLRPGASAGALQPRLLPAAGARLG